MRFRNLDLNLLVALDVLLAERNVSRAAERLNMTQSALSNALARLRQYFDDDLLVPVGRVLKPTPRAELLVDPVRDILTRIESSVTSAPEFDPASSDREFRIYASDYSLTTLVPRLMHFIAHHQYPLRFEFRPQTDQPHRTLERGDADLLIIPSDYASVEHPSEVVHEESFVCIADIDHPRIGDTISLDEFLRERHAVMKPPSTATSIETHAMQRHGIVRDIDVTTYSFASLPHLVAGTQRIATVHAELGRNAAKSLPIKVLRLPFDIPKMRQSAQWHTYRTSDPALIWLRSALKQA